MGEKNPDRTSLEELASGENPDWIQDSKAREKIKDLKEKEENLWQEGSFSQGDVQKQQRLNERIQEIAEKQGVDPSQIQTPEEDNGPSTVGIETGVTKKQVETGEADIINTRDEAKETSINAQRKQDFIEQSKADQFTVKPQNQDRRTISRQQALNRLENREQKAEKRLNHTQNLLNRTNTIQQNQKPTQTKRGDPPKPLQPTQHRTQPGFETEKGSTAQVQERTPFPSINAFEAQDVDPQERRIFNTSPIIEDNPVVQDLNQYFENKVSEDLAAIKDTSSTKDILGNEISMSAKKRDNIVTPGEFVGRGASVIAQTGLQTGKEGFDLLTGGDASLQDIDVSAQQARETGENISFGLQKSVESPGATADLIASGTGAMITGYATDEFNFQRSLPPFAKKTAEQVKENPSRALSQMLFGAALAGPTGSFKTPVYRSLPDDVNYVRTKADNIAFSDNRQTGDPGPAEGFALNNDFEQTQALTPKNREVGKNAYSRDTFGARTDPERKLIQDSNPRTAKFNPQLGEETSLTDILKGNIPDRKKRTTEVNILQENGVITDKKTETVETEPQTRTEFIQEKGLSRGQKDVDQIAGLEIGEDPITTKDKIVQAGKKLDQKVEEFTNPEVIGSGPGAALVKSKTPDTDTDTNTISIKDRIEKFTDDIRTPEDRNTLDFDITNRRDIDRSRTEFNVPDNTQTLGISPALGVGAALGLEDQQKLDQPQNQDQLPRNDQLFKQEQTPEFKKPQKPENTDDYFPINDNPDLLFEPRKRKDPDTRRRRDFDRRRNKDIGLGKETTLLQADTPAEETSSSQGFMFTPTLESALFGQTETVTEEQFQELNQQSFTGLGDRNILIVEENNGNRKGKADEKLQDSLGI